jgi:hypothetical protein
MEEENLMSKYPLLALSLILTWQVVIADERTFDALDSNDDGLITSTEAEADSRIVERFSELDVNGDGFLNLAEYATIGSGVEG